MTTMWTIDYETEGIDGNVAVKPPRPVGVSIKKNTNKSKYYAWGHPTENNCTEQTAVQALHGIFHSGDDMLFHNPGFDLAVAATYHGFSWAKCDPRRIHDTQYSIFLHDPYSRNLSLKPSAERILGLPPDEQDAVRDWVLANVPAARAKPSTWGAYICLAPGKLVGRYACGDTDRTHGLHAHLHPQIMQSGMLEAYRREQRLLPILHAASKRGVRVDRERLARDVLVYGAAIEQVGNRLRATLGDINLDSPDELADALESAGYIDHWEMTATGKRSTARPALRRCIKDPTILDELAYYGAMGTCLSTFALPWLEQSAEDGRLHPQWNQVRTARGGGGESSGARTGRMSCNDPNLQNVPTDFEDLVVPPGLPPPIEMRRYLLPEQGHVWLKRDFSAQEMRWLAHFAEGTLLEAFKEKPDTDPHEMAMQIIHYTTHRELPRKKVKITAFGIVYGEGIPSLAGRLNVPVPEAADLRGTYLAVFPEVDTLSTKTKARGKAGLPIRTWGGRLYHVEPAGFSKKYKRQMSYEYKLLNYLIQGSSADQTKESIIEWNESASSDEHLLAPVHDEVNISVPEETMVVGMEKLALAMDRPRGDCPMRSEGFYGTNWADIDMWEDPL